MSYRRSSPPPVPLILRTSTMSSSSPEEEDFEGNIEDYNGDSIHLDLTRLGQLELLDIMAANRSVQMETLKNQIVELQSKLAAIAKESAAAAAQAAQTAKPRRWRILIVAGSTIELTALVIYNLHTVLARFCGLKSSHRRPALFWSTILATCFTIELAVLALSNLPRGLRTSADIVAAYSRRFAKW